MSSCDYLLVVVGVTLNLYCFMSHRCFDPIVINLILRLVFRMKPFDKKILAVNI